MPASNTAPVVRVSEAHGQHSLKELNVVNEAVDLLLNGIPSLPATDNKTWSELLLVSKWGAQTLTACAVLIFVEN